MAVDQAVCKSETNVFFIIVEAGITDRQDRKYETCCASISLEQLAEFCHDKSKKILDQTRQLAYGPVRRSEPFATISPIMLLPSDTIFSNQFKGYIWIGYVQTIDVLVGGLKLFKDFLRKEFNTMPSADHSAELEDFKPTSEPFRLL
ncbi:hypothetical protein CEP53_014178 [Fusarium sp. AF-6]|nr:hypothetical protein CEP53_014178 [Fusarium sp. AF-6]